jgi:hypothetical protein
MRSQSLICGIGHGDRRLEHGNTLLTLSRNHSNSISFDYYVLINLLATLSPDHPGTSRLLENSNESQKLPWF